MNINANAQAANLSETQNPKPNYSSKADTNPFVITVLTAKKPDILTKSYTLKPDGTLQRDAGGNMLTGDAKRVYLDDLPAFANLLVSLKPNQALTFGCPDKDVYAVHTAKSDDVFDGRAIARTREYFAWLAKPSFLMLDYDPPKDSAKTREELLKALIDAVPALGRCGLVWYPSGSSHISRADNGYDLTGLRGQRVYVPVTDARDIERTGRAINTMLWASGYGYIKVSGAGTMLTRTLVDTQVWQPERLDFASGAACGDGLIQRRGTPYIIDGVVLDSAQHIPDPSPLLVEAAKEAEEQAKAEAAEEAAEKREQWLDKMARKECGRGADKEAIEDAKKRLKRTLEHNVLMGDFEITVITKAKKTVNVKIRDVLDRPTQYHGLHTLDPIEPDYKDSKVCGKLYLVNNKPTLFSQARGGRTFKLLRQPRNVDIEEGRLADAVTATIDIMKQAPDIFASNDKLGRIVDGQFIELDEYRLLMWCANHVSFSMWTQRKGSAVQVTIDPTTRLLKTLLVEAPRQVKRLNAIRDVQTMDCSGRLITKIGFDEQTGILLDTYDDLPNIATMLNPSLKQTKRALDFLMLPFKHFDFVASVDRSILLSALLTTAVSSIVPTRPAFAFDAPSKGSGKTLLAQCVAYLIDGQEPVITPTNSKQSEEEIKKALFSAVRENKGAYVWDNIMGQLDSPSFAGILTGAVISDRVLGKSQTATAKNNTTFILTGNNLTLAGELPRRILKCRIDPNTPTPFNREFEFNPLDLIKQRRSHYIACALIIMRGWFSALGGGIQPVKGKLASFEQWDDLVRQPVAWIAAGMEGLTNPDSYNYPDISNNLRTQYTDVMEYIKEAYANDPDAVEVSSLFHAIHQQFGDKQFTAQELLNAAYTTTMQDRGEYNHGNDLADSLRDITGRHELTSKSIGRVLNNRKDRIAGGFKLKQLPQSANSKVAAKYRVIAAG